MATARAWDDRVPEREIFLMRALAAEESRFGPVGGKSDAPSSSSSSFVSRGRTSLPSGLISFREAVGVLLC